MMKYIDYFAAPNFARLGDDWLYKARLLVSIILTYMVVISIFGLFFAFFPGTPVAERLAGLIPVSILGLSFVGVLFVLRQRGMFRVCAHTVIGATYAGIAVGIYMTGGPVDTPSGAMLLLPVFLAFSMLSMPEGFIWAGIVLVVSLVGMVATFSGYQFPMVTAEDRMQLTRAFNWVMAYLALVSLMFVYQMMNNRLRKERDRERHRYQHVVDVANESLSLHETADALNVAGQDLLDAAISQKSAIEQLATTTEELAATAEQNRSLAQSARSAIADTERHLSESTADIMLLAESMHTVKSSGDEIQTINNVVNDIAWQTNLLSLNAMIEASRAGEGNGGFKVVAQEVKKLAERSAQAADDINVLLGKNVVAVTKGVELSDNMQKRFGEIVSGVEPLTSAIQNVSDASSEQHEAVRQITQGLDDIDTAVGRNQQMAEQIAQMVLQLRSSAAAMVDALETLKQKGIE